MRGSNPFFEQPIINSPYQYPNSHWKLDETGQPTGDLINSRRPADFITPIPRAKKQRALAEQAALALDSGAGISTEKQQYDLTATINRLRLEIDRWRKLPNPSDWKVTPETQRLLQHWRTHKFSHIRPFFCQIEAVETAIWLTEVAPKMGKTGALFLDHLEVANESANPGLNRLALKLATGAGKTMVMAMIIAWQTINAARHPGSTRFTKGFLVVTPGITIKDRLRVLQPNDPNSYYRSRELVPTDLMLELKKAKIVITNYHSFKLKERMDLSKGGRQLLQGRHGDEPVTVETEGQMIQRVMQSLMGMKNILVLNDEGHHCYLEKPGESEEEDLQTEEKEEAQKNTEAARLWISGIEMVSKNLGVQRVFDLSATPFFLRGSGYAEGTLFHWTMSDFSLMDAIESGIVKLPRVPVSDNIPDADVPKFRNLWENIRGKMPKKGRGKSKNLDPLSLHLLLKNALEALYGHYEKTFEHWRKNEDIKVPPCFIIVCNNTSASKLVYDYISGFYREDEDGTRSFVEGRSELFRNFSEHGERLASPHTLLIDSEQLESGDALDPMFREIAADQLEQFRREKAQREGGQIKVEDIPDTEILREVMNTVGQRGKLGESIRCVVSVSMLTEGWDANTVTHILGVRAFGTQLLCEQVIGRALRRQSYELNEDGLFDVEYADVLGIPFDFNALPTIAKTQPPRETVTVHAIRPARDSLEIRFPRVQGYRVELPTERLVAEFTDDSTLELTPDLIGPTQTENAGIIGENVTLNLIHTRDVRHSSIIYELTTHLLLNQWREPGEQPRMYLFGQLKAIVRTWLKNHLVCKGDTYPAQLLFKEIGDMACERITNAITRKMMGDYPVKAVLDPYNSIGSTSHVLFNTSKALRWETSPQKCHINWCMLDSEWEGEFCRVAEAHPQVLRYVKNHNLGLEVPYVIGGEPRTYIPDFIVVIDDGHGPDDPLNLIVEIKGYRREDAKVKKETMETHWVPGVNNLKTLGRWAFAEFTDVYEMQMDFAKLVEGKFNEMIDDHCCTETL